jgi:hypothetical protein
MPFDGTELGFFENHPLAKLGAVEGLLSNKERWCKGKLRDSSGRHCLIGAMQAVEGRHALEPIILRAARKVGGKHYWRIEFFNDDPGTTHAHVLRVLRRAREDIIAGMVNADRQRPWHEKLAQSLRAIFSRSYYGLGAERSCGPGGPLADWRQGIILSNKGNTAGFAGADCESSRQPVIAR